MEVWKKHIKLGNRCFGNEHYLDAEREYRSALTRSKQLFHAWLDHDEAVWSLIVSYQNLADLLDKQNQSEQAITLLQELNQTLTDTLQQLACSVPSDEERQMAIRRGLRSSYAHMLNMQRKSHGACTSTDSTHSDNLVFGELV
ncbi:MAG: hypothetical protein KTR17_05960 [Cellvibrionaceae bacterium]|nr:hypothetical protein [Cellvibrionaceae bacterium]